MDPVYFVAKGALPIIFKLIERCDPLAFVDLKRHANKTILFEIQNYTPIWLQINEVGQPKMTPIHADIQPDVGFKASIADLFALLLNQNFTPSQIKIQGDLMLAQDLFKSFKQMDLNWEQQLEAALGPVVASILATQIKKAHEFNRDFATKAVKSIQSKVQTSNQFIPSKLEVATFGAEVEKLRDDIARLEARIEQLQG